MNASITNVAPRPITARYALAIFDEACTGEIDQNRGDFVPLIDQVLPQLFEATGVSPRIHNVPALGPDVEISVQIQSPFMTAGQHLILARAQEADASRQQKEHQIGVWMARQLEAAEDCAPFFEACARKFGSNPASEQVIELLVGCAFAHMRERDPSFPEVPIQTAVEAVGYIFAPVAHVLHGEMIRRAGGGNSPAAQRVESIIVNNSPVDASSTGAVTGQESRVANYEG